MGGGDMREVALTQGKVALVDDEDYEDLSRYKWHARKIGRIWYAERNTPRVAGRSTTVLMHRQVVGAAPGQQVDHQDGNGLHNWRENLRYSTPQGNAANRHHKTSGCTSHFKGVCWHKDHGKWAAQIKVNHRHIYLGYFDDEADAARAYNAAAVEFFGAFAYLNAIDGS